MSVLFLSASFVSTFQAQASLNKNVNENSNENTSVPSVEVSTTGNTDTSMRDPYERQYGVVAGFQFPTGPVLELNYRPFKNFSIGVSGGGLSLSDLAIDNGAQQKGVKTSISTLAFETKARWHVMNRAFFMGLAAGWQSLSISGIDSYSLSSVSISRYYVTPHLGWLWVMNSGFTIGTEFGLQVPISPAVVSITSLSANSSKSARDMSSIVLPYLNVIKLGYSF